MKNVNGYPALTGSNLSVSKAKRQIQGSHIKDLENLRSVGGRLTAGMRPIGSTNNQWGEENPH